jgi:hypothetical protein
MSLTVQTIISMMPKRLVYATATMQIQWTQQQLFSIAQTLKHATTNLSNDDPPNTTFQAYASRKICQKHAAGTLKPIYYFA